MNVNGNRMRRNSVPVISTTTEKMRPASDWKVMSPKPNVVIVTSVQYTAVGQLCDWPSRDIRPWNEALNPATSTTKIASRMPTTFRLRRWSDDDTKLKNSPNDFMTCAR